MTKITVRKRDARVVDFDKKFIDNAVYQAALNCDWQPDEARGLSDKIAQRVSEGLEGQDEICVDEIQDLVERKLIACRVKGVDAVAKAYIEYRHDRDNARNEKNKWVKLGLDILNDTDKESERENSNLPRGSILTKQEVIKRQYNRKIADDYLLPKELKDSHTIGDIHIHDLDQVVNKIHNCILMDYPYMFNKGFQLGNKFIQKPNSILTAMNVLVQMVQVQQNLQYGGLTLADVDVHMACFVEGSFNKHLDSEKEALDALGISYNEDQVKIIAMNRTEDEVYKAAKLLSYQLNTLQVRGESSPFVTITYGKSTDWAGTLIQKMILQERLDEFENCGVQSFPKHQFICQEGVNLNKKDPNYNIFKLANKVSARTCYPDYIFPRNQELHTGGSASYMGCRSLLSPWYNEDGELTYLGRANTGVVSLNLPRIAIQANKNKEEFFRILSDRLDIALEALHWRYKRLINMQAKEAEFSYLGGVFGMEFDPEDTVEKAFAKGRGSSSMGYIGLHEVALLMCGEEPYKSEEAHNLQIEVLDFINSRLDEERENTDLPVKIYSTPAEALTDRLCTLDKEQFGEIKGVTDKGFYINSFHVNTETKLSPFAKIDLEAPLQAKAHGGHIVYIESHNLSNNLEAYETFVKYAYDKGIMHFAINSGWDYCTTCHWNGELELTTDTNYTYTCPDCGEEDPSKVVLTRRLCGYTSAINKRPPVEGRIKEMQSRVKHGG